MTKPILLLAAMALWMPGEAMAQDASHPVIPRFGAITPMPDAAVPPDKGVRYRTLFNITKAPSESDTLNLSLDKVARYVNLLGSAGVRPRAGDIVVIIHGPATPLVMNEAAYRARFGVSNPNSELLARLKEAGVEVHVCGQALAAQKIDHSNVNPQVTIDLSAMTTLSTLQLKGWALITD